MKIKVNKEELLAGIGVVGNIVSQKTTLPILSNMLLEVQDDILKMNTTDLNFLAGTVIAPCSRIWTGNSQEIPISRSVVFIFKISSWTSKSMLDNIGRVVF